MSEKPEGYQTYLLRLWNVQVKGKRQWHASLESPHTGERQLFSSLEQLFTFVSERCAGQAPEFFRDEAEDQTSGKSIQTDQPGWKEYEI